MSGKKVLVIGAGVSGLSSAILLSDAGFDVTIQTKDLTENTTSNIAAAFWYPYLCNPKEKAVIWSKNTYEYLEKSVMNSLHSGTRYITFTEYLLEKTPDPWWKPAAKTFERPALDELPDGYVDGFRTKAIVMDTSRYLPWLVRQIETRNIPIEQKTITSISDATDGFEAAVNCSGLGAKDLCNDDRMFPVRGQVVRIKPNGFEEVIADESNDNLTYIIPRFDDIIIGGTSQENDWNLEVDPRDTEEILRRAAALSPVFKNVEILQHKVGLRPARDEVRLELEMINDIPVVHNYGHGGAGFTLSWGCAQEVVELLNAN